MRRSIWPPWRKLNGFDVFTQAVSVKAGGSTEIHATIQLSEEDKAYFAENYKNGCYVEGYVYASDPCGIQAELSLPFLAYYGAWTDASMFDPYITLEDSGNPDAYTYVGNGYANALTIRLRILGILSHFEPLCVRHPVSGRPYCDQLRLRRFPEHGDGDADS